MPLSHTNQKNHSIINLTKMIQRLLQSANSLKPCCYHLLKIRCRSSAMAWFQWGSSWTPKTDLWTNDCRAVSILQLQLGMISCTCLLQKYQTSRRRHCFSRINWHNRSQSLSYAPMGPGDAGLVFSWLQ